MKNLLDDGMKKFLLIVILTGFFCIQSHAEEIDQLPEVIKKLTELKEEIGLLRKRIEEIYIILFFDKEYEITKKYWEMEKSFEDE